jgi:glycosyltransferase involved in cell wall biosynthesis
MTLRATDPGPAGDAAPEPPPVDLSFVAIGFNEAALLEGCIRSLHASIPEGLTAEVIYVDAGSRDDSLEVARRAGADLVLGGEKRRRAAENRNIGFRAARGRFIQFVDGDMALAPDWPAAAHALLEARPEVAAVCGNLNEANESLFFRALELDWMPREGVIRHCGGAALYRREVLERLGGFPEDVAYGEEPLLCWRIRNELKMSIYQLNRTMADHDLGFRGFRDYWRRNVRCGATYAEIAARCRGTSDPLWLRETVSNALWAAALVVAGAAVLFGPWPVRALVVLGGLAVLGRKALQVRRRGLGWRVAAVYALHAYLSKLPIAWGELQWLVRRVFRGKRS